MLIKLDNQSQELQQCLIIQPEEVTVDGLKPVTDASVNSDYTVSDKKASKITTADGKVYD